MRCSRFLRFNTILLVLANINCTQAGGDGGVEANATGGQAAAIGAGAAVATKEIPDWKSDWSFENPDGTYAKRQGPLIKIGNSALERVYRLVDDSLGTIQLVNKLTGRDPGSQQWGEFALQIQGITGELTAPDFRLKRIAVAGGNDPKRVEFVLQAREHPELTVIITIETPAKAKFQRKWLTINWSGQGEGIVDRIDVESTGGLGWWYIGNPTHLGMGQPMFVADLFMGLEHPAGEITTEYLRHFPGKSAKAGVTSKSAIWGVAKDAASVPRAFFDDYLNKVGYKRETPFVIWNLLSEGIPEEKKLLPAIDTVIERSKKAGFKIDSFAIDDLWQDCTSIWQPDAIHFPHGFEPLTEKLDNVGSRLGLWLSLDGFTLDTRWGKSKNLEITTLGYRGPTGGRYCQAGPRYHAELVRVLKEYLTRNKVNYFKCDYNVFGCDVPGHGHGIGPAGKEAQIDAYIDILRQVKATTPECRVALTTGMWLSPWWCLYSDYIWLGGSDMDISKEVKSLTPQDGAITYRDGVMYEDFIEKGYVFPFSSVMTHGFWELGDAPFEKFQDDCVMTVGRGIAKWEVLNSIASMDEKRFAFLGSVLRWGKANWDILASTRMILGDPRKGEIYGYSHVGHDAALIFLRNPGIESKRLDLTPASGGLTADDAFQKKIGRKAMEIYPVCHELDWDGSPGGVIRLALLGSQTKCIALVADEKIAERVKLTSPAH